MEQLLKLYKEYAREEAALCEPITGSGSRRQYYRLSDTQGHSVIGVVGTSREENHAFLHLTGHFQAQGLPVPQVLHASPDEMRYLQTDLGHRSLFDALRRGREAGGQYDASETALLHRTIALLPDIQVPGARGLDFTQCYPQSVMDETCVMFDLNYFKYCFLKTQPVDFHELRLEEDFRQMARDIAADDGDNAPTFLYRDFQARNVILAPDGSPHFIDYQGGRRGPLHYDLASFLWQASARYPDSLRQSLLATYLRSLARYRTVDEARFLQRLPLFVLFRLLQVLGAYGFRGYFERKPHFLQSIPPALGNLRSLLDQGACPYPTLHATLRSVLDSQTAAPALVVRVYSFSYKRGIPQDESGNGGGYVFDCRSTHNPGRYEPYKHLTGLDQPVVRFLEGDGEILRFLDSVYQLADAHVQRYIQRGFTSLMFSFGCTGGQHRSVYCAQHLAQHLHQKFGIAVHLCHREQGIQQDFPALA